jgi:hypothetical protein
MPSPSPLRTVLRLGTYAAAILVLLFASSADGSPAEEAIAARVPSQRATVPNLPTTTAGWLALGLMAVGILAELGTTRRRWR